VRDDALLSTVTSTSRITREQIDEKLAGFLDGGDVEGGEMWCVKTGEKPKDTRN